MLRVLLAVFLCLPTCGIVVFGQQIGSFADTWDSYLMAGFSLWPLADTLQRNHLRVEAGYRYRRSPSPLYLPYAGWQSSTSILQSQGVLRTPRWAVHGQAGYRRAIQRWVSGSLVSSPGLFYPYLVTVGLPRHEVKESYSLAGDFGYRLRRLSLGLGGDYSGITHFSREDPRVRGRSGDLGLHVASSLLLGRFMASMELEFRYLQEALSVQTAAGDRMDTYYYTLGLGLYDHYLSIPQKSFHQQYSRAAWLVRGQLQATAGGVHTLWAELASSAAGSDNGTLPVVSTTRGLGVSIGVSSKMAFTDLRLSFQGGYRLARRLGYEVLYDTVTVHVDPSIVEMHEYARFLSWRGIRHVCGAGVLLSYHWPWGVGKLGVIGYGRQIRSASLVTRYHWLARQAGGKLGLGIDVPLTAWRLSVDADYRMHRGTISQLIPPADGTPPQLEELSLLQYLGRNFWGIGGSVGISRQLASEQTLGLRVNFGYFSPWGKRSHEERISLALWYALGT